MSRELTTILRHPLTWVPAILSLLAMGLVVGWVAVHGVERSVDEGSPARIFQLLMLGDGIAIGAVAARWLPKAPAPAITVIVVQLLLAAIPVLTVMLLEM